MSKQYSDFTRSALSRLFDESLVLVNGHAVKAGHKLRSKDKVAIDDKLLNLEPPKIKLPIVYEDDDVIVINKPAGILTHAKGALNLESTAASFIKDKITDPKLTGNRAGIVHRLDRATSGLMITAKNTKALAYLQKQFSTRKVKKTYLAIVEGWPSPPEAIIDAPIARNPKRPQTFRVSPLGKSAKTECRVIENFKKGGQNFSLVELKPLTGRTHQIRVHMAYIGNPVVGDIVYGHDGREMLLHAKKLELNLPNGRPKTFTAPTPKVFEEFSK